MKSIKVPLRATTIDQRLRERIVVVSKMFGSLMVDIGEITDSKLQHDLAVRICTILNHQLVLCVAVCGQMGIPLETVKQALNLGAKLADDSITKAKKEEAGDGHEGRGDRNEAGGGAGGSAAVDGGTSS